jgi:hypothetical protein
MEQKPWKPATMNTKGDRSGRPRTSWPGFILYPAMVLGALITVMAIRVASGLALEGQGWQKVSLNPAVAAYSPDHPQTWDKPLTTLAGDNDDDNSDDDSSP